MALGRKTSFDRHRKKRQVKEFDDEMRLFLRVLELGLERGSEKETSLIKAGWTDGTLALMDECAKKLQRLDLKHKRLVKKMEAKLRAAGIY